MRGARQKIPFHNKLPDPGVKLVYLGLRRACFIGFSAFKRTGHVGNRSASKC